MCSPPWLPILLALSLHLVPAAIPAQTPEFIEPTSTTASADFPPVDVLGFRAVTVDGEILHLGFRDRAKPVGLVFLGNQCVISRRYVPSLAKLADAADRLGVELVAVMSNPAISWRAARAFRDEYKLALPLVYDSNGELGRMLKPKTVPTAIVVDLDNRITYRGRIDDRFPSLTKIRKEATSHDLLRAMEHVAQGTVAAQVETEAVGCVYTPWPEMPRPVTYNREIAPILNANCVECHQSGGIAPFSLASFSAAKRWSTMIHKVTSTGLMPPWKAEKGFGHFREERFLTPHQLTLLSAWRQTGAKEGNSEDLMPAPPPARTDWKLGEPDLVLTMAEAYSLPADGEDIYRYFVLPMNLTRNEVIVAMDFRPGDATVVHHANFFVDYEGKAREADSKDPAPGFSVFGTGGFMSYTGASSLGAWAPGVGPYRMPDGRGFDLPQGGDVVLEVHYHLTGKETTDKSSFAFYFADGPVERGVSGLFIGTQDVAIPAGADDYWRRLSMEVPAEMQLVDIAPHMHYLGAEAKVVATLPTGEERPLLHVTDWDLRWQGSYTYRQPVTILAGSRIDALIRFDNSRLNVDNPNSPPKDVTWGWGSDEEMAELYMTIIAEPEADRKLQRAALASWTRPAEPLLADAEPEQRTAEEWLAHLLGGIHWDRKGEEDLTLLSSTSALEEVTVLCQSHVQDHPKDANGHALLGTLLAIGTYFVEDSEQQWALAIAADNSYERALKINASHWNARLGRAAFYAESQDPTWMREAVRFYRKMLDPSEPSRAQLIAFFELGKLYENLGKKKQATEVWRQGLTRYPDSRRLQGRLDTEL